jgi:hypothetical protein
MLVTPLDKEPCARRFTVVAGSHMIRPGWSDACDEDLVPIMRVTDPPQAVLQEPYLSNRVAGAGSLIERDIELSMMMGKQPEEVGVKHFRADPIIPIENDLDGIIVRQCCLVRSLGA